MSEGDVVLILDKKKPTLPVQSSTRYRLGVVEEEISPRSFKVRYAQHSQTEKKTSLHVKEAYKDYL